MEKPAKPRSAITVNHLRPPRKASGASDDERSLRVCGAPAVRALFARAPNRIRRLFFDRAHAAALGDITAALAAARKPFRLVQAEELERVAGTKHHAGVCAVASPPILRPFDPEQVARLTRAGGPTIVLDGIGNPHNLGAIARTAAFFGCHALILADTAEQAHPTASAHRVAEGGLDHLELFVAASIPAALRQLARDHLVVGTATAGGIALDAVPRDRPVALVLGNEETGLDRAALAACDVVVTIAGSGRVQSLNVAASAALLIERLGS